MPEIGRPQNTPNKYAKISMAKSTAKTQALNEIKTNESGIKFVDRKKHNKMGKDEFLKLLTYQLTNQDPMKPMDQKQFSGQLAQFAQLEQLTSMNKALAGQSKNAPTENKFYAASFLGKQVTTSGTTLDYDGTSGATEIPFYLPKAAKNVMIRLFDSRGQLMGQIERENLGRGDQSIIWDGIGIDKMRAMKDSYTINVRAWDDGYNEFKGETKAIGTVTGVSFENGETVLKLDGKKSVFLRDVETFKLLKDNNVRNQPMINKKADSAYRNSVDQVM